MQLSAIYTHLSRISVPLHLIITTQEDTDFRLKIYQVGGKVRLSTEGKGFFDLDDLDKLIGFLNLFQSVRLTTQDQLAYNFYWDIHTWTQVGEGYYDHLFSCVPPACIRRDWFAMGDPWGNNSEGETCYICCKTTKDGYFAKITTLKEFQAEFESYRQQEENDAKNK